MLENISILSKLDISGDDEKLEKELLDMIKYVSKINSVDTDGVEPMSHVYEIDSVYREDTVTNENRREELLADAPVKEGEYIKVPKTI